MACEIRIGTSGWHYAHWKGRFYPEKAPPAEMFRIYLEHFDSVEINNTFYHLPPLSAFENWKKIAPPGFLYALKGSRFLTHMKKLREPDEGIARFFEGARLLGRKLGPIVFQLPPRWRVNLERLEIFLAALPRRRRYAFEFRDPSWLIPEVYEVLRSHNAAFCIYDIGGFHSPFEVTAEFSYVRLHGPSAQKYQGSYDAKALAGWARWIERESKRLKAIYIYFDNDHEANAVRDALELRRLVTGEPGP